MKIKYLRFLFKIFFYLNVIVSVNVCYSQNNIILKLRQPPPNKLEVADLWQVTLTNTGKTENIYLHGTAFHLNKNIQIVDAQSTIISLDKGIKFLNGNEVQPIKLNSVVDSYKAALLRTGLLPSGSYRICIDVIRSSDNQKIASDCITQTIANLSPPKLIFPLNNSTTRLENPIFSWLPPVPIPIGLEITYTIIIKEILGRQSDIDAMNSNPAWFIENDLMSNSFQFPLTERKFINGKQYSWKVIAYNGKVLIGESEVWLLKYEMNKLPDKFLENDGKEVVINNGKDSLNKKTNNNGKEGNNINKFQNTLDIQNEWDKSLDEKKFNGRLKYSDLNENFYQKNRLNDLLSKPSTLPNVIGVSTIFGWDIKPNSKNKYGGGVRLFFGSDWFPYGCEEVLGVVIEQDQFKEPLDNKLTDWSGKPIWRSGLSEGKPNLKSFGLSIKNDSNLVLLEEISRKVYVSSHIPEYDTTSKLWYCDIQIDLGEINYSNIRLSLVRYRPNATEINKLSQLENIELVKLTNAQSIAMCLKPDNSALIMTSGFDKKFSLINNKIITNVQFISIEQKSSSDINWKAYSNVNTYLQSTSISKSIPESLINNLNLQLPNDLKIVSQFVKKYRLVISNNVIIEDKNFNDKLAKSILEEKNLLLNNKKLKGASIKELYEDQIEL
ncbi:MAG: hypothetical protein IPP65_00150 [Chlorobi bacterium]|nr:hypothetical protein [Chlorobiota bacterium]